MDIVTPGPAPVAVGVEELQRIMSLGWPGIEQEHVGEWILRFGGGFTGRANSALPVGDPGVDLAVACEAVRQRYLARGLRPRVQVPLPLSVGSPISAPDPVVESQVDVVLSELGWMPESPTWVLTAAAAAVRTRSFAAEVDLNWASRPDDVWLHGYRADAALPEIAPAVITAGPAAYLTVRERGEPVGFGRVTVAAGWAGLFAIEVPPAHRRRGLGSAITSELVRYGRGAGAESVYLQVLATNDPAIALYEGLGFTHHHSYRYRVG